MEYVYMVPLLEVLFFNLIILNNCFTRKYSIFKTIAVLWAFTAFGILPLVLLSKEVFSGNGRFSILGFIYLIPLKFLYDEKWERIFLNMCMSWTYTMGIMAVSVQIVHLGDFLNYGLSLTIIETILFLITFIPFREYMIPKYVYIVQNIYKFQKIQFTYLKISVCLNFFMLFVFHIIFLTSEKYLLQIIVLIIFLAVNYIFYSIVYEVIRNSFTINELEKTVLKDSLTGLGNRMQMMSDICCLMEKNFTFSIMFLDLDGFKLINDYYGHGVGDKYLIHFGKVFSDELKDKGKLYRYGGDEFVAIYYGVLSEEIADSISQCKNWNEGAPCKFNQVSIGLVVCEPPYSNKDPNSILKHADSIMYRNKLNKKMRNQEKN